MIAISYRRDDSLPVAGRLYDRLQATFGKPNIFMDFDSIRPGLDFRAQIRQTIDRSDVVIAVIGPGWLGAESDGSRRIDDPSDFVRLEIAHALQREIPIIPVLVNHTSMPKPETLPEDIRGLVYRHALPLDTGLDFHQHADRLIAGVSGLVDVPNDSNGKPATTRQGRTHLRRPVVVLSVLLLAVIGASAWFWFGRKTERGAAVTQGAAARVSTSSVAPSNPISPPDAKPMVEISSQPSGARVLNDGITIGTTPLRRDDLGLGPAKFVLMADGYLPRELSGKIDSVRGLKAEVSLALAAPLYAGEITVRGAGDSASNRPLAIALSPDLISGTMTQSSKRGDFMVRFAGLWKGAELHAVTGDVVAQPAGIQWTPESFILRFSDDGRQAGYECVAGGRTYVANLSAQSELLARVAPIYKGTVLPNNTPIKITIAADRRTGTLAETTKSGDTVVAFTGIWDGDTLHAVTGEVISKPEKVQWRPESFSLRITGNGRRASYSCNDEGKILTAELSGP